MNCSPLRSVSSKSVIHPDGSSRSSASLSPPGFPVAIGVVLNVEGGFVFGRELEFSSGAPDQEFDPAWVLRSSLRF